MEHKLAISALVIAGAIGNAGAAPLVSGTEIGVDFGPTAPTNNYANATGTNGSVAAGALADIAGTLVDGVSVTWAGGGWSNNDAATEADLPGQPTEFNDSNLTDWLGQNNTTGLTITFAGLDDALSYELLIGSGFIANATNVDTRWTVDSQIGDTLHDVGADAFVTFTGLSTNGSGQLVITGVKAPTQTPNNIAVVSALQLTATTPPAGNTWQTDGNGNWSTLANWNPAVPNGADVNATFDDTLPLNAPLTATLDVPVTLGDLVLASAQAITIDGASSLTFDSLGSADLSATAGSHEIAAAVSLANPLDVTLTGGSSVNISGALSGTDTVSANGDLTLSGDLSGFTGGLISTGGTLNVASGTIANVARINSKEGGEVSVSGTVTLANNASFGVGSGIQGTTGSLTVETGGELNIGAGSGYTGIGGGDVFAQRSQSGNGTLTIAGGTLNVAAPGANNGGAGGLDSTNFWMNPYGSGGGTSTVNLDGGLLSTARTIRNGSGSLTVCNFNGGTLQAAAASAGPLLANLTRVNVRDGGGTIDTNGFDITYNGTIVHSDIGGDAATDGGLTKIGSGTLTLGGANTYTGPTTVSEGSFALPASGSLVGDMTVDDGAGLSGVGTVGGLLTLGNSTGASLQINTASATGIQTTDLTLNGVTTLGLTGTPGLGSTFYAIATYSGALIDGNGGSPADSFTAPGYRIGGVSLNGQTLEVEITTESGTWTGTTSGNWTVQGPDANWDTTDNFYYNGDDAIFTDTGANKTVTLLETVSPGYTEVNNTAGNDYIFTGAFGIAGSGQLVKDGGGNLVIETDNSYSGATTISSGTVQVGTGGTSGSLGSGAVVNDGALTFNRSDDIVVSNGISGIGTLVKDGAGNLTFNVANPYTGGTIVSGGTLTLGAVGATSNTAPIMVENGGTLTFTNARHDVWGNAATTQTPVITIDTGGVVQSNNSYNSFINLVLNGGTLSANGGANANYPTFGLKGTVTINATAGGSFISTTGGGGSNTVAIGSIGGANPNFTPSDFTTFDVADGAAAADLTVSAPLSNNAGGSKGLIKTGTGTMVMNVANTYANNTVVEGGVLSLGDGTNNTGLADASIVSVASGAVLDLNYSGTDVINGLTLSGAPVTPGIWGATGSGATNIDDTHFTGSGTLTVNTVTGAYGTWAAANGLTGADADPNADLEDGGTGDGLNNLLEFAFGTDPNAADNVALTVTDPTTFTAGTVRTEVTFSPLKITLQYVRRKDFATAGLAYTPEFMHSGGVFIPDPDTPTPAVVSSQDPGDYEVVEVPFLLFDSGGVKAESVLGRVAVTLSP